MVFVVALTVRLAHVSWMRTSPFFDVLLGDAQSYDAWGRQIASGDWIGRDVFYQAPLYAYFLGVIYAGTHSLVLVRLCQALIGAGSCVLLGYAARRLFDQRVGLAAGLMLAFYAPSVFSDGLVQKSVLDIFSLCLLLALLSGPMTDDVQTAPASGSSRFPWRWITIGGALGILSLTRENALVFVPIVIGWIWLSQRAPAGLRGRMTALLLAGLAVVLLPVGLRNRIVGGEFHLTTAQSGPNFFIGNNPNADGTYMPLRSGRGSPEYERVDATALAELAIGRTLSPGEVESYWTTRALDYIRTQPLNWLKLEARKFRLLWNVTEVIDTESQESHADYSAPLRIIGHFAHFGVLAPLALAGMWITWSQRRRLGLLYALLGGYVLSLLAFYVVARYRLPLAPFLMVFAAAAVARGARFVAARTPGEATMGLIVVAGVAIFCNWPTVPAGVMRAVTYQNLGATLQTGGRLDEAAAAYRHALELKPDYAPSHDGLGSVLRQQGKIDEAIGHLKEALRLRPDSADTSYNLANALADGGKPAEAIALYEELLQRRPDAVDAASNVDVHSNLGILLASTGRLDEAIDQFRRAVALAPQTATPRYNLGHTLFTRGDYVGAIEQLSVAIKIDPAHLSAHSDLGNIYMTQRRFEQAAAQYREAVRLSPKFVEAHNNLGIVLGSLGRLDEAIEEFELALQIDPTFVQAQSNLQTALAARQAPKVSR